MHTLKHYQDQIEHKHKVSFVQDYISKTARYMTVAEEAAEVAQAAAKVARIFEGTNPTPKTLNEAFSDLNEEMNDLYLSYEIATGERFVPIYDFDKLDRCVNRVCEANDISYEPFAN